MKNKIIITSLGLLFNYPLLADEPSYQQQMLERAMQERPFWQAKSVEITQNIEKLNQNELKHNLCEPSQLNLSFFPVETSSLTPGNIQEQKIDAPQLAQPIFIIGSDEKSKEWLKHYVNKLKDLNAIGFVVQAQSQKEFDALKSLADSLPLIPLSGNALAERFKLEHYPVLISQHAIEQ